jgi:uncharacterized protein (TIGR02271 family)
MSEENIKLIEEKLVISKEIVETGKVHIRKTVTEEVASVNIPITNEIYQVERVEVPLRTLDSPPEPMRQDGDTTIIPVVREITVVQKKYQVIEEIHIHRTLTQTPLTQEITLRKEHINVERSQE